MSKPEQELEPLSSLLRQATELDDIGKERSRAAFLNRVDERRKQASGMRFGLRWLVPGFTAAVLITGAFVWWPTHAPGYEVRGAANEGGYIRALNEPAEITFSDRTRLLAAPGTRVRVEDASSGGARVLVEQGRLEVHVVHAEERAWTFVAGPFQVHVTGTRFDLAWDVHAERLDVALHEGSLEVEGYSGSGTVAVRAGQHFSGDARQRSMLVTFAGAPPSTALTEGPSEAASETNNPVASAKAPAADPKEPEGARGAAPSAGPSAGSEPWSTLVSKGEFRRILEEATARGIPQCLTACSADELGALADAARYKGRGELAKECLLALRGRFSASSGNRAAFLLGRLHEGQGQNSDARGWYETSLRESPRGPFASESLAGKMRVVNVLEGRESGRAVAREYLRAHPNGVHAGTARQLLDSP